MRAWSAPSATRTAPRQRHLPQHLPQQQHSNPATALRPRARSVSAKGLRTDYLLDLNELLVQHPSASFYCQMNGDSMVEAGIFNADYLLVDRSEQACHGDVVVVAINGELACKIFDQHRQRLLAANPKCAPILLRNHPTMTIEGVVTSSIRRHRCSL